MSVSLSWIWSEQHSNIIFSERHAFAIYPQLSRNSCIQSTGCKCTQGSRNGSNTCKSIPNRKPVNSFRKGMWREKLKLSAYIHIYICTFTVGGVGRQSDNKKDTCKRSHRGYNFNYPEDWYKTMDYRSLLSTWPSGLFLLVFLYNIQSGSRPAKSSVYLSETTG